MEKNLTYVCNFRLFARMVVAIFIVITATGKPMPIYAADISLGIGAVDEGDDRAKAAAVLSAAFANNWWSKVYFWGRSYGPVTERSGIISAGKRFELFGSKDLRSSIGITSLAEYSAIKFSDAPSESSSYTSTNFGLMFGMSYDIYKTKNFTISGTWDSHLYAAGQAVILLVTGRKQILGLTAGMIL